MKREDMDRRGLLAGGMAAAGAVTATGATAAARRARPPYRRIATEEGYLSPGVLAANARASTPALSLLTLDGPGGAFARACLDIGAARLAAMDRDGIDLQLLLLSSPGVQVFERATAVALAREANDYAADACRAHPTRFAALAAIAPQDPAEAARELERATHNLRMKGALINSHTNGEYLDLPKYWPIFEAAEALDVPVYIHPREPAGAMNAVMTGPVVAGAAWAYGVEVGTHVLKLIGAGVFDRFPRLRVVIGHMGEALPFWLPRIDNRYLAMGGGVRPMNRMPSDYLRENIWVTTSGMNYWPQLRMTLDVVGADRVLYATDYPFERQGETVAAVEAMPLSIAQKRTLFETNAARLFRL